MPNPVIVTSGLSKKYGAVTAVEGLDLRVVPGEIYGFLGLNGAGKSTTIRMLLGMVRPSSGRAEILGEPVRADMPEWRRVGHLVEGPVFYPDLTARQNLEVVRRMMDISDGNAVGRIVERMGLGTYADRRAGTLSAGNKQRLGLARALMNEPELLILDEPANALDPAGVVETRELLRDMALNHGVTVFMSSHILAEVDRLATRIGIIHRGRLLESLEGRDLEQRREVRLEVETRKPAVAERALRKAGFRPERVTFGSGHPGLVMREPRAIGHPEKVGELLVKSKAAPTRLAVVREDLEELFLRLTSGGKP
jgi:ABC-2 type transport system ATP-binding protein